MTSALSLWASHSLATSSSEGGNNCIYLPEVVFIIKRVYIYMLLCVKLYTTFSKISLLNITFICKIHILKYFK